MPRGKKELAIRKLRVSKSSWDEARPLPMAVKKIGVTERLTRSSRPRCYFKRWRQHTNTIRPHSALGYRPPAPPGVAGPLEGKLLTKKLASFMGAGQLYAICSQGWLLWMAPADTCDFKPR